MAVASTLWSHPDHWPIKKGENKRITKIQNDYQNLHDHCSNSNVVVNLQKKKKVKFLMRSLGFYLQTFFFFFSKESDDCIYSRTESTFGDQSIKNVRKIKKGVIILIFITP